MLSVIYSFITLELYTHLIGITVEQVISVLSRQYEQLHVAVGPGAHIEGLYDTEKECQLPQHWRHVRHLATYLFLGIFCRQSALRTTVARFNGINLTTKIEIDQKSQR